VSNAVLEKARTSDPLFRGVNGLAACCPVLGDRSEAARHLLRRLEACARFVLHRGRTPDRDLNVMMNIGDELQRRLPPASDRPARQALGRRMFSLQTPSRHATFRPLKPTWILAAAASYAPSYPYRPARSRPNRRCPRPGADLDGRRSHRRAAALQLRRVLSRRWTFEGTCRKRTRTLGTIKGTNRLQHSTARSTRPRRPHRSGGPFTVKDTIGYRKEGKTVRQVVTDSPASVSADRPVGGDLGGYFNIYYESGRHLQGGHSHQERDAAAVAIRSEPHDLSIDGDRSSLLQPRHEKDSDANQSKHR